MVTFTKGLLADFEANNIDPADATILLDGMELVSHSLDIMQKERAFFNYFRKDLERISNYIGHLCLEEDTGDMQEVLEAVNE